MLSITVVTSLLFVFVNSQGPSIAAPQADITPPDVINLFIQNSQDGAGDLVASVVGVVGASISLFDEFNC